MIPPSRPQSLQVSRLIVFTSFHLCFFFMRRHATGSRFNSVPITTVIGSMMRTTDIAPNSIGANGMPKS